MDGQRIVRKNRGTGTPVSVDNKHTTDYRYDANGERIIKKSELGETQYVSANYIVRNKTVISKHIFAGNQRVASTVSMKDNCGTVSEKNTMYFHPDHLGSSSYVTDKKGNFFEMIEYLPYGETLYDEAATADKTEFRFTSKEQDAETGLYYHGARYRDAKTGVWLSCDPYLERYLPTGNKEKDKNLPADGIFRVVNMNLYHYAGNNPVKYVDPDGNKIVINGDLAYKKAMQNVLISIAPGAKIDMKTGVVSMDSKVSQRHFKKGTELMSKLVSDPHTVTISPTAGDPQANAINLSGASNPLVGSDTNIDFDPKKSIDLPTLIGKKTAVDKKTHPVIVLSHELIHALDNAEGIRNPKLISNYLGLHGVNVDATWMPGGGVKTNELTTVGLPGYNQKYGITENSIRKEQGLNPRPYY